MSGDRIGRLQRRSARGVRATDRACRGARRTRADAGLAGAGAGTDLGDRRPRDQRHARGRDAAGADPAPGGPADAADPLPRGPGRAGEPRRLPPHGPDRVARPAGGGALRAGARRAAPRPRRLLDGRRDRRPVHAEVARWRRVAGLVLDAPALDWKRTIEFNSEQMGLPGFAALPVLWAIGARIDADWNSLDALAHPEAFHLPILLFHGLDDKVVPIATSNDFAAELPRWVTYYQVPHAGHTQSWNVDPQAVRTAPAERFSPRWAASPRTPTRPNRYRVTPAFALGRDAHPACRGDDAHFVPCGGLFDVVAELVAELVGADLLERPFGRRLLISGAGGTRTLGLSVPPNALPAELQPRGTRNRPPSLAPHAGCFASPSGSARSCSSPQPSRLAADSTGRGRRNTRRERRSRCDRTSTRRSPVSASGRRT